MTFTKIFITISHSHFHNEWKQTRKKNIFFLIILYFYHGYYCIIMTYYYLFINK